MKVQLYVKFREIGRSVAVILFLLMVGMVIGWSTAPEHKAPAQAVWGTPSGNHGAQVAIWRTNENSAKY